MTKLNKSELVGAKTLDAVIKEIATTGAKLDHKLWVAAVSAMKLHDACGQTGKINAVIEAMPKGARTKAMRDFINAHGSVTYNEKTKLFDHDKYGLFDLEGACEKSWTEFKPEQPYKPVIASKLLKAVMKKVADQRREGDEVSEIEAKLILECGAALGIEL